MRFPLAAASGGDEAIERLNRWVAFRNNYGVKLGDKEGDEFQQFDTSLSELDAVIMTEYQIVAAAANVPSTKLLGTAPKGFNATGAYEEASYHEELESIQAHDLTPLIERHHALVMRSYVLPQLGGELVETTVSWKTLDTPTAKELAEINQIKPTTGQALVASGAISSEDERRRVATDPDGGYNGIGLDEEPMPDEDPDDDDDGGGDPGPNAGGNPAPKPDGGGKPTTPAATRDDAEFEAKHERAENGRFGKGSGSNTITNANGGAGGGGSGGYSAPKIGRTGNGPRDFITFNGSTDLGHITDAVVKAQAKGGDLQALPIRLQVGWTKSKGEHRGTGLRHIEEEHGNDIKASGLSSAQYVHKCFSNVQRIYEEQPSVFFCEVRSREEKAAMVRLDRDGDFYTVHTIYDKRNKNLGKLIWSGRPSELTPSGPAIRPAFGQDSTTADSLDESLAAPLLSYGDDTASETGSPNRLRAGLASQISGVDFTSHAAKAQ